MLRRSVVWCAAIILVIGFATVSASGYATLQEASAALPFDNRTLANFRKYFFSNIDYRGTGAIMASPSTDSPNYFYDWVRDAGITMSVAPRLLNQTGRTTLYSHYQAWTKQCHQQPPVNGIDVRGEPKFYMDGRLFDGPWGRPQTDGPGLRAMALMDYAEELIAAGKVVYVEQNLWHHDPSQCCGIKYDLEFVAHNWNAPTFDVWEEVMGNHFFTLIIQRKALVRGASLAVRLNDGGAADFYNQQAAQITKYLENFWMPSINNILVTLNPQGGADKTDGLDTAVLLGVLYGGMDDLSFGLNDDRVLATANNLVQFFNTSSKSGFTINDADAAALGAPQSTLLGRYPLDTYNGVTTDGLGNPWFLTTSGTAEVYFRTAARLGNLAKSSGTLSISRIASSFYASVIQAMEPRTHDEGSLRAAVLKFAETSELLTRVRLSREPIVRETTHQYNGFAVGEDIIVVSDANLLKYMGKALLAAADGFFLRMARHLDAQGHMAEQIHRNSGYQQGARDLTWSYGATLSAVMARDEALQHLYN